MLNSKVRSKEFIALASPSCFLLLTCQLSLELTSVQFHSPDQPTLVRSTASTSVRRGANSAYTSRTITVRPVQRAIMCDCDEDLIDNDCLGYFICLACFSFFGFWTFFSIVGAIHYSVWYPRFDLDDVHMRTFNVTPDSQLSYDMDILIVARHFNSPIRRITKYSYDVRTSHAGTPIAASKVRGLRPIHNRTMTVSTTQTASGVQLGTSLGESLLADLNATGRVALRLYIEGQVYTSLFLAQKSRRGWTCDLIVSPDSPLGSQVYDRLCCSEFRCLERCGMWQRKCCTQAPNCCVLPPSSLSATISICG